jgi:putative aminopeptidase FrvX
LHASFSGFKRTTSCRRYSHSPVELLDINDAIGTMQALVELCRTIGSAMQTIADIWV